MKKPGMYYWHEWMFIILPSGEVQIMGNEEFQKIRKSEWKMWRQLDSSDELVWEF